MTPRAATRLTALLLPLALLAAGCASASTSAPAASREAATGSCPPFPGFGSVPETYLDFLDSGTDSFSTDLGFYLTVNGGTEEALAVDHCSVVVLAKMQLQNTMTITGDVGAVRPLGPTSNRESAYYVVGEPGSVVTFTIEVVVPPAQVLPSREDFEKNVPGADYDAFVEKLSKEQRFSLVERITVI